MHGRKPHDSERRFQAAANTVGEIYQQPPEGGVPPVFGAGATPAFLTAQADGVTLAIKLQPRASKNELGALTGPELRIKVTAPPVDAAANEALLRLLADKLDCSHGKVELIRGHTARHKVVKVHGLTVSAVLAKLSAAAR